MNQYLCRVCNVTYEDFQVVQVENYFVCFSCAKIATSYFNRRNDSVLATVPKEEPRIPSVKEMIAYLDRYVIGQQHAKKSLAMSFYLHLVKHSSNSNKSLPGSNLLIVGATGSGKTYMVQKLAEFTSLCFVHSDVSRWTEGSYIGGKSTDCLISLFNKTQSVAEKAVIFLDEIDKLAYRGTWRTKAEVQGELLRILDGSVIDKHEVQSAKGSSVTMSLKLDSLKTSGILFIAAGAFSTIDSIIDERKKGHAAIGFHSDFSLFKQPEKIIAQDLINYGMMPELMGRMHRFTQVDTLTKDNLIDILIKSEESALIKYKNLFMAHNKTLVLDDEVFELIADNALALKTGARGLA
jgi:ATP-dependent Clp protease ATP-binding subunit ClpX